MIVPLKVSTKQWGRYFTFLLALYLADFLLSKLTEIALNWKRLKTHSCYAFKIYRTLFLKFIVLLILINFMYILINKLDLFFLFFWILCLHYNFLPSYTWILTERQIKERKPSTESTTSSDNGTGIFLSSIKSRSSFILYCLHRKSPCSRLMLTLI